MTSADGRMDVHMETIFRHIHMPTGHFPVRFDRR
jgi:hypothetical protein